MKVSEILQDFPRTVQGIVKAYLETNGFDGLFNGDAECACQNDNLFPCGEWCGNCEAGYKGPCNDEWDNGFDWAIYRDKPGEPT